MMKKMVLMLSGFAAAAVLYGADALWDGNLGKVSLREGAKLKEVSAKTDANGLIEVNAKSEGDSVTYVCIQVDVPPFKIGDKALSLRASSDTPKDTAAFYVRGISADGRKVLSYQRWGSLTAEPKTIELIPGNSDAMTWETAEIKAPLDTEITKLWIYIGARGDAKPMNLHVGDFKLVESKLPPPPASGTLLKGEGPGVASLENNVITAKAKGGANATDKDVTYFRFELPFTGDITGKSLLFTASTANPGVTGAFYVRGYNADKQCILSFMSWSNQLAAAPRDFVLTPGKNSSGLNWEAAMVKPDAKPELAKLEFFIGSRGNALKDFSAKIENIRLGE